MCNWDERKPQDDKPKWKGEYLESWEEFLSRVESIRNKRDKMGDAPRVSKLLFRGENPKRNLQTSLERYWERPVTLNRYVSLITEIRPEIEKNTKNTCWDKVPDPFEYCEWIEGLKGIHTPMTSKPPGYGYLAYLRHHGFPSLFLDWSRSPYVAAYFAYADVALTEEWVSIYVYWEFAGKGKVYSPDRPFIVSMGPHVDTHHRHTRQQSEYTFCIKKKKDEWVFAPHGEAVAPYDCMTGTELDDCLCNGTQDLAWKFNLPVPKKWHVLSHLDKHDVNGFSLFGTEDELVKTLAMREVARWHTVRVGAGGMAR